MPHLRSHSRYPILSNTGVRSVQARFRVSERLTGTPIMTVFYTRPRTRTPVRHSVRTWHVRYVTISLDFPRDQAISCISVHCASQLGTMWNAPRSQQQTGIGVLLAQRLPSVGDTALVCWWRSKLVLNAFSPSPTNGRSDGFATKRPVSPSGHPRLAHSWIQCPDRGET